MPTDGRAIEMEQRARARATLEAYDRDGRTDVGDHAGRYTRRETLTRRARVSLTPLTDLTRISQQRNVRTYVGRARAQPRQRMFGVSCVPRP